MNKLNEIINSAPSASSLLTGAAIVGGGLVLDMKDAKAADIALTLDASASLIANTEDSPSYVYYVAGDLEGADHARTVEISGNDTAQVRNAADTDYVSVESALTSYDSDKFDDPLVAIHDIEGSEVLFSDYNAGVYCFADLS